MSARLLLGVVVYYVPLQVQPQLTAKVDFVPPMDRRVSMGGFWWKDAATRGVWQQSPKPSLTAYVTAVGGATTSPKEARTSLWGM